MVENTEELAVLENDLGIENPKVTQEQVQAAYALNLCSVSVSQIIDYNDINILEQEYEAILNNLNLEHMPKDEALLDIIKRLLETITFFRIQEGEKEFIEKDYQHKMKNAIWSAMPNPGALISTGLSTGTGVVGLAVSLAASVGTAYMNYRKNRAEYQLEREKRYWELKKTAMEQFQTLQQQLFETSWRLADKYAFPDVLRLSERQIKQYNNILMDADEVRKFERLDSIKHKFAAYPPFWYYFGNTANSIALSEHYGLDESDKEIYRNHARTCFEYFSVINKYDLLREDGITAACYLEYVDLLDPKNDIEKITDLIKKAVVSAGNSLDVLQLCAIAYMKIGETDKAAYVLRQLVNEQYNEVTNAQLLSTIYVNKYIKLQSAEAKVAYKLLETRVNSDYLFPLPEDIATINKELLQYEFIKAQRSILKTKYKLVLIDFIKKYEAKINSIIPIPDDLEKGVPEDAYADKVSAREERVKQVKLVLYSGNKSDRYRAVVQSIAYSFEILEVLNKMFDSICLLECVQDQHKQLELQQIIKQGIQRNSGELQKIDSSLTSFDEHVYEDIQKLTLRKLTQDFFVTMAKEITSSVDAKTEMKDFAIAEFNLVDFCKREGFEEPEILFAHKDDAEIEDAINTYFTPDLIGKTAIKQNERIQKNRAMIEVIHDSIEGVVCSEKIEFYTQEDPRMNRYFYGKALQKYKGIRTKTLAVLDDRSKGDMDLLFTTEGVMPIIRGKGKATVAYSKINWSKNSKKKELLINGKYANEQLDMDNLYELIKKLAVNESKIEGAFF
nr:MAG TPA: hypothetical protein [Caudoviricetes sp.]